jgi:hypothetical protein
VLVLSAVPSASNMGYKAQGKFKASRVLIASAASAATMVSYQKLKTKASRELVVSAQLSLCLRHRWATKARDRKQIECS